MLIITLSLAFILNLLSEIDFFKEIEVDIYYPLFFSILNSPALVFEMFPFIFLITTQLFLLNFSKIKKLIYLNIRDLKIQKFL